MRQLAQRKGVLCLVLMTASCMTTQGRFVMLGQPYPPHAVDCKIDVFRDTRPERPFESIARLDFHVEKTFFAGSRLDAALPELKKQACLSGADAIIDIQERSSHHIENQAYHVTATGIKFK